MGGLRAGLEGLRDGAGLTLSTSRSSSRSGPMRLSMVKARLGLTAGCSRVTMGGEPVVGEGRLRVEGTLLAALIGGVGGDGSAPSCGDLGTTASCRRGCGAQGSSTGPGGITCNSKDISVRFDSELTLLSPMHAANSICLPNPHDYQKISIKYFRGG